MGTTQTPILELIFGHSERQSVSEDPPTFHPESRKITDFRTAGVGGSVLFQELRHGLSWVKRMGG